jgi:tetratricopeptide (TPR) repeat protein
MVIFLTLLFVPIILLGFVSVYEVNTVGNSAVDDSRESLSTQAEANLMSLVNDKATEANNFFESIQEDTAILMDFGNDVYNNPEEFHNGTNYPTFEYISKTVPYLPAWGQVSTAIDERNGAWADWGSRVQSCPYLNSSVVNRAANDPVFAEWLRDEINKTVLFDHMFKPIYDKNQPNVELVWMVRHGGLTNSYSVPPLDYGQLLMDEDLTDDWDEDTEDYVTLAGPSKNPDKTIVWTDTYFDPVGGGWLVSCLGPLYLRNKFIGDVGIDIKLDVIRDIILGVRILETGHAFLINSDGNAISHPNLKDVRAAQMELDEDDIYVDITKLESGTDAFRSVVRSMRNQQSGLKLVKFENGIQQYVAYAPIESTGYSIGVVISEAEINELVSETEDKMNNTKDASVLFIIVIIIITTILVIISSVTLARRITRPIKQLTLMTDQITKGNLHFEVNEEYTDEMKMLAQSFRNLLITLRLGNVAYYEGDTKRAFENYKSALSLFSATGNRKGQSMSLNNLGNIYRTWKDYKNASRHYNKAVDLDKKINNTSGIASRYVNLGLLYRDLGDVSTANSYFQKAYNLFLKANDKKGIAMVYNNMGLLAVEAGKKKVAMDNFIKAHEIDVALNDRRGLSSRLNNMAMMYKNQGQYRKAISLLEKSMKLSESYEDKTGIMNNLLNITKVHKAKGDWKNAAVYETRYKKMRTQVLSTSKRKTVIFVIDTSGSMEGDRLEGAISGALNLFKRKIYDQDLVSAIEFFSESRVILPLMQKSKAKKKFEMALRKVYADGMTAFYDALGDALTLVRKSDDPNMAFWVVALTDGEDNSSFRFSKKSVIQFRDTTPQDVTLVIISVADAIMQSELRELCGPNGTYLIVGQEGDAKIGKEIRKAYREIEDIFESSEVVEGFVPEG